MSVKKFVDDIVDMKSLFEQFSLPGREDKVGSVVEGISNDIKACRITDAREKIGRLMELTTASAHYHIKRLRETVELAETACEVEGEL